MGALDGTIKSLGELFSFIGSEDFVVQNDEGTWRVSNSTLLDWITEAISLDGFPLRGFLDYEGVLEITIPENSWIKTIDVFQSAGLNILIEGKYTAGVTWETIVPATELTESNLHVLFDKFIVDDSYIIRFTEGGSGTGNYRIDRILNYDGRATS